MTPARAYRDLHDFGGTVTNADGRSGADGGNPQAAVTFDSAGNMYGTTVRGGPKPGVTGNGDGMVWEITRSGACRDLHDFGGTVINADGLSGTDGAIPASPVTFDAFGNLFGTAATGGANRIEGTAAGIIGQLTAPQLFCQSQAVGQGIVHPWSASSEAQALW